MSDRRADDTSIAPRRSLSGAASDEGSGSGTGGSHARSPQGGGSVLPPMPKDAETSSGKKSSEKKKSEKKSAGRERRQDRKSARSGRVHEVGPETSARDSSDRGAGSTAVQPVVPRDRRPRTAQLRMTQVDPWSVTKTAFLLSIAIGVVTVVAVAVVWSVLGASGLWDSINTAVQETIGGSGEPFRIQDYLGTSRVLGFTMIVAVVDIVLITMIATLGAFLYNLAATLLGGIEVTLAEED